MNILNWYAQEEASGYFKREWTPIIDGINEDQVNRRVRAWDIAGTLPSESSPYPDFTVGVLLAKMKDGTYVVEDMIRFQQRAGEVENTIMQITQKDREYYSNYRCVLPQDPAAAGKIVRSHYSKLFASHGIPVYFNKTVSGSSKVKNFEPFAATAENGLVSVLKGEWNTQFFKELEQFDGTRSSSSRKDDIVDATATAFNVMSTKKELPKIGASAFQLPSIF